ncbi:MAG: ABC transporter permease [Actinomycetota bacterium]|nr:ABC transporter permease [Actinomycetota bacterium]
MKLSRQQTAVIVGTVAFLVVAVFQSWAGRPITFDSVLSTLIVGVSIGSIYAIAASGIVVTYTTSGIFNFAQGAIGMFMAFVYWQLRVDWGIPAPLALILAIFVIAPLFGAGIERVLMRRLTASSLVVQLVVTVGLMFALMGLAVTIWDPTESRSIDFFFGSSGFEIGSTFVLWHRFITICAAIVIAIFLRLLLYRTRIGVTMRAVVDNRSLAGLHGARPEAASMLAWALGSSMAAISGILLVPELGLQVDALTLLIINAFAAAIVGRLKSLPLTYVGAILLGLSVTFATNYLELAGRFSTVQFAIPTIFLFIALLALPQARIELRKLAPNPKLHQPRLPRLWETALGMVVVFGVVWVITRNMGQVNLNRITLAMVVAMLMLSLVPLTGWAGQVSFAQITFAGAGAFAMYQWAPFGSGSPAALILAAAFAVPFGVLMCLPALRLQGLYLALASIAFVRMAESLFFDQPEVFGNGAKPVPRLAIFNYRFTDQRAYLLLVTGIFGAMALFVVWMRRGRFGRRLVALRDSEAASATLGVSAFWTKLAVYGVSAGMAGFAGALLGGQRGTAATQDFALLGLLAIPIVLLVVVGGVETVSGALFGGILFILFPVVKENFDLSWLLWVGVIAGLTMAVIALQKFRPSLPVTRRLLPAALSGVLFGLGVWLVLDAFFQTSWLAALERLGPGLLALNVAVRPNGASVEIGFALAPLLPWRKDAREAFKDDFEQRLGTGKQPPPPGPGEPGDAMREAPAPAAMASGEAASSRETRATDINWKAPT